ncbi:hypothetical protein SPHINGO391_470226 [Sphingomonas aurantiaca]|uniref:Uncharacterized protein n=1 Tax=Sphingomonas aurantiaca TaxID=185949 RepID=A0A5E7ZW45_9SPHN|nr:hypothetical protein SPHINGO391_470226 [Sphingomonas aurantiaca]
MPCWTGMVIDGNWSPMVNMMEASWEKSLLQASSLAAVGPLVRCAMRYMGTGVIDQTLYLSPDDR